MELESTDLSCFHRDVFLIKEEMEEERKFTFMEAHYVPGPCQELYFYVVSQVSHHNPLRWGLLLSLAADGKKIDILHPASQVLYLIPSEVQSVSPSFESDTDPLLALANGALANPTQAGASELPVHRGLPALAAGNQVTAV